MQDEFFNVSRDTLQYWSIVRAASALEAAVNIYGRYFSGMGFAFLAQVHRAAFGAVDKASRGMSVVVEG